MEYCTLAELKTALGITGETEDTTLTSLIITLTALVDLELGWNLGLKTITRRISGMGTERIILEGDIIDVTSAKLYYNTLAGEYETVEKNFIDGAVVYFDREITKGRKNLELTYTRGFENVPVDMKVFFLKYCKEMYKIQKNGENNVKAKKIEGLSVTYLSPSEIIEGKKLDTLSDFASILKKYKNFNSISY